MASNQYSFLKVPQTYSKDAEDTLFTITLDELDVGLLPLNKLLDKYNGDQSKPIWDLGTNKKTLKEYSDVADQYVKLQVSAEAVNKAGDPQKVVETQYCQLCCISIPIIYTGQHIESAMHRQHSELVSHMLEKAKRQMQRPLSVGCDTPPKRWSYCTTCNVVLHEHSQFEHSKTDRHNLSVEKEQVLSRLVTFVTEEKPPVRADCSATDAPSTSKTTGKESFPAKKVESCCFSCLFFFFFCFSFVKR